MTHLFTRAVLPKGNQQQKPLANLLFVHKGRTQNFTLLKQRGASRAEWLNSSTSHHNFPSSSRATPAFWRGLPESLVLTIPNSEQGVTLTTCLSKETSLKHLKHNYTLNTWSTVYQEKKKPQVTGRSPFNKTSSAKTTDSYLHLENWVIEHQRDQLNFARILHCGLYKCFINDPQKFKFTPVAEKQVLMESFYICTYICKHLSGRYCLYYADKSTSPNRISTVDSIGQ